MRIPILIPCGDARKKTPHPSPLPGVPGRGDRKITSFQTALTFVIGMGLWLGSMRLANAADEVLPKHVNPEHPPQQSHKAGKHHECDGHAAHDKPPAHESSLAECAAACGGQVQDGCLCGLHRDRTRRARRCSPSSRTRAMSTPELKTGPEDARAIALRV